MKVTSWNVNSIRSRLERVLPWLDRAAPDVLCLQETKVEDAAFPREPFEERGYHVEAYGQKTYNGVAIISKERPVEVVRGLPGAGGDARLLAASVGDLRIVDVYVPNGRSVEDPQFEVKLGWLGHLRQFLDGWAAPEQAVVVLGDFNVAPDERDVHDPELWRGKVHFHPKEHEALAALEDWGLQDLFRLHEQGPGFYSWWDYRMLGFPKNRGLRIDLVLGTPPAAARCREVVIERDERKGKKPSDHAPVTAVFGPPGA